MSWPHCCMLNRLFMNEPHSLSLIPAAEDLFTFLQINVWTLTLTWIHPHSDTIFPPTCLTTPLQSTIIVEGMPAGAVVAVGAAVPAQGAMGAIVTPPVLLLPRPPRTPSPSMAATRHLHHRGTPRARPPTPPHPHMEPRHPRVSVWARLSELSPWRCGLSAPVC